VQGGQVIGIEAKAVAASERSAQRLALEGSQCRYALRG
jgi:hypothetical protein